MKGIIWSSFLERCAVATDMLSKLNLEIKSKIASLEKDMTLSMDEGIVEYVCGGVLNGSHSMMDLRAEL